VCDELVEAGDGETARHKRQDLGLGCVGEMQNISSRRTRQFRLKAGYCSKRASSRCPASGILSPGGQRPPLEAKKHFFSAPPKRQPLHDINHSLGLGIASQCTNTLVFHFPVGPQAVVSLNGLFRGYRRLFFRRVQNEPEQPSAAPA